MDTVSTRQFRVYLKMKNGADIYKIKTSKLACGSATECSTLVQVAWHVINSSVLSSERQNEDLGDFVGFSDLSSNFKSSKNLHHLAYIMPNTFNPGR